MKSRIQINCRKLNIFISKIKKVACHFGRMNSRQNQSKKYQATIMKSSKSSINRKTHAVPNLRFEDQKLTSFSGLTVFQTLFDHISLKNSLRACFKHRVVSPIFGEATIVLLLVIHLLLGYRELRHLRFYQDDPMVK